MVASFWISARRLTAVAATSAALFAAALPSATAAPATDGQGFVDSTARCTAPDEAVAFGSTTTSRVAICETPDGQYEYRGVRLSDGAKLIVPASRSGDGGFVADNDGITYTLTASSLVVSVGRQVIREESMVDYYLPQAPASSQAPPQSTTPAPQAPPQSPLPAEKGFGGG